MHASEISTTLDVVNDLGLHLRAAGILVQRASQYRSELFLSKGTLRANAKSIMSVLSLAASKGTKLTLTAQGEDAQQAINAIAKLFNEGFVEL
ncbi:MAG: HPr family phosphocarrier protein [Myxococcota bacterium]